MIMEELEKVLASTENIKMIYVIKVVFAKDLGLSAYPAKAVARSQDLGECAKEDDQALCIHGFQGSQAQDGSEKRR